MNKLVNKFWKVLNEVRGFRDIQDLKELFISLIFLKHANDRHFSNSFIQLSVPKNSKWSFLANNLQNPNFLDFLNEAFFALERENDQIKNSLSSFDFRLKSKNKQDLDIVENLFIKISEFGLLEGDFNFSNFIGELLSKFSDYEGKRGVALTTPDSVSKLMIQLLNPKEGSVLDSACGTGGFFQKIKNNNPKGNFQFYGQESNYSTLALAKLRFAFNEGENINFSEAKDSLIQDGFPNLKADYILMNPPFNVRDWSNDKSFFDPRFEYGCPPKSNGNLAWIQHAVYHLNKNGKAAILLNNSSLSSGGKEGEIRKRLINADVIEAIITLPAQLLSYSSISSSLWILNKNKIHKEKILFIDALDFGQMINKAQRVLSDEDVLKISTCLHSWENNLNDADEIGFSKSITIEEIKNQEFQLQPNRYIEVDTLTEIDLSNAIKLREILDYVRPKQLESEVVYKKVSIKDLSSTPDSYLLNINSLEEGGLRPDYRVLEDGFLLIARLGNKLKPTYTRKGNDELAFSSSSIYSFTVKKSLVNLEYLIAELHKDYIKKQIENFRKGAGISFIRKEDLLSVKIKLPQPDKQKEIFEKERELRFQAAAKDLGFEKEIAKLKDSQMRDLGSKKHNIMQHLNNVKASADVLTEMMGLNNGVLKADEIIDPKRGVTVEKRFLRLQESLNKVIYYVDNITNELKYDEAEIINVGKFIKECKERGLQNDLFTVEVIFEGATFQEQKPLISISKNDFEEMYNNILENAITHGFVDKRKSYVFRISIALIDNYLEINFTNNGKSFPKGMAENFDVKGGKAGATAGTGIGLWKVAEIAKHFDCKLEVYDEPKNEFPVGFKFKFNIETI
tara:strand:+ start:225 stop:2774 length:2550 start_codon:yes stop_codon:yes gene_type:complete